MENVALVVLSRDREGEKEDWDEAFLEGRRVLHLLYPWDRRRKGGWKRSRVANKDQ